MDAKPDQPPPSTDDALCDPPVLGSPGCSGSCSSIRGLGVNTRVRVL